MTDARRADRVGDLMTRNVVTVGPEERIGDVVLKFVDNWIDGAPVVTGDGTVVGMITDGDLVRALAGTGLGYAAAFAGGDAGDLPDDDDAVEERVYRLASSPVTELMTREVITVSEDTPLADAAQIMSENLIKKLPVVRDGRLVGLISRSDIVLGVVARVSMDLYRG